MEPENRWVRFGLGTNPYFPEPLSADVKGPRPISLFQGRQSHVKELVDTIAGEEASLSLVEGPSGTGKSTFVNYAKHVLRGRNHEHPRYFAPSVEVGVQSDSTAQSVLIQVIDALVRHASDLRPKAEWAKGYPAVHRARTVVEAVQNLGWSFNVGGALPGGPGASLGLGRSGSTAAASAGPVLSPAFFQDLVRDLLTLTDPPMKGVVIHVNNLDVLMQQSAAAVQRLFGDLRDHFQVSGSHWVFLGPPGLRDEAVAPEKRVKDFLKAHIELQSLPLKDMHALLEARYEHYKVRPEWVRPTATDLVDELYGFFGGDLRGTLNAISTAHRRYNPIDVAPMSKAYARDVLATHYRDQLETRLRGKTKEILQLLIKNGKKEFSQDDVKAVEKHQPNRSQRFAELAAQDAVRLVRNVGPKKLYTFGGPVRIAYGAS